MGNLSTLKRLATCLGCCKGTKDNPAKSNAEALEFINNNFKCNHSVNNITLHLAQNGKLESGTWTDSAGEHEITIN